MSATSYRLPFVSLILFSFLWLTLGSNNHENFLTCLSQNLDNLASASQIIYTQNSSSYSSVLESSIRNIRFSTPQTPKPFVIVTPLNISHIQATLTCSKRYGMEVRVRSGGHDFEGLSYVSDVPFVIIDMVNLSSIDVDVDNNSAWVEVGATTGQLYYRISEKSRTLAFPSGLCPTIGLGGHISGGGWGMLMRKYGIAADNILDARFIDANGILLDRKSMGEDLFWAIRGGGGGNFGVTVAWKIKLVTVPSNVTVAVSNRTLEQNATAILNRWQYVAHKLHEDVIILVLLSRGNSSDGGRRTIQAQFFSYFLGGVDRLLPLIQNNFPELGLVREECFEMSWIQSASVIAGFQFDQPLDVLLNRTSAQRGSMKIKSDYVREPIPETVLEGLFERFNELGEAGTPTFVFVPYGGKMSQISESEIPFPHRAINIFKIIYTVSWGEDESDASPRLLGWIRAVYSSMTPHVSKNPRAAYVNYRDLDIGTNNKGFTSVQQARIWGEKYFKNNFDRLVRVKTMVDPHNFFKNEQSIPPLSSN